MTELGLHGANCLNDCCLDIREYPCRVMSHLLYVLQSKSQTSLVPEIVFFAPFVLDVVGGGLVDRVVGEVHIEIVQIVLVWRSVFAGCQSA